MVPDNIPPSDIHNETFQSGTIFYRTTNASAVYAAVVCR